MEIRRYVVTIATADGVDNHVSAEELADCLSDYIGISYANLVECYRISDLQIVDGGLYSFTAVPEPTEQPEADAPTEEHTGYQGLCVDALPAEAKYIAADESGRVYWYPAKPVRMQHGWFCENVTWKEHLASELDIEYLGNWEDSLYELCTVVHKDTPTGVPEPEGVDAVELTEEQQAILDAPQHAELPSETTAYGEENGDWPPLDVSKLNPPADARWVAVDKDGRAYYYADKPQCGLMSWYTENYRVIGEVKGHYDMSNWQEAIWPVNLDSQRQAELPSEQPAHSEEDMSRCEQCKYPHLDVSRLNPPAEARWVAVDSDGTAYYYAEKPRWTVVGWCESTVGRVPGRYDTSNWKEAIWPVNIDATPQAELPPEQPVRGEVDMSELLPRVKYPRLDVSKLNPPEKAHWVAVDNDGNAYYYGRNKPQRGASGWSGAVVGHVSGHYDASKWFEAIWPVNLEQGS